MYNVQICWKHALLSAKPGAERRIQAATCGKYNGGGGLGAEQHAAARASVSNATSGAGRLAIMPQSILLATLC